MRVCLCVVGSLMFFGANSSRIASQHDLANYPFNLSECGAAMLSTLYPALVQIDRKKTVPQVMARSAFIHIQKDISTTSIFIKLTIPIAYMLVPLQVHTLFQNQTLNSEHVKRSGLKAEFLSQFCQLTFGSFSLLFCLTMLDLATQENGDHSWHMASVPNLPWPFSKQTTYLEHKRMISRSSLKFVQTLVPPLLSLHRSLESIFDVFLDSKVCFCKERRSAIYK